jgi:dihydrofolate reductase
MTRTTYYTATTLDGYIADEHHSLEWLFKQDIDQKGPLNYDEFIARVGAVIMGSSTYEWILRHNAKTGDKWSYSMPSWVFTHRDLGGLEGADIRFVSGDVAAVHAEAVAAAEGRDIWVVGGGDLAGQFADAGLLDDVLVSIAPVTLGTGAPLLPRRLDLKLRETVRNRDFITASFDVVGLLT